MSGLTDLKQLSEQAVQKARDADKAIVVAT